MKNEALQDDAIYDLTIIGGGINGVGIANDAAGRGLNVLLVEQNDLASGTSSRSSKLIHGGLRYLEYYDFKLVRKALREREILLKKAPHIIKPMRFILPHSKLDKPIWMIRIGLFLYDHLAKLRLLKKSEKINLQEVPYQSILKNNIEVGFEYSDCWDDDARLVALNAIQAKEKGGTINTRMKLISACSENNIWVLQLEDQLSHENFTIKSKVLINAAGPWLNESVKLIEGAKLHHNLELVKGSHLIVPRMYEHDKAYILPTADDRIVFVIPYLEKYSLIGTTDVVFHGDPKDVKISKEEITYLLDVVNTYFNKILSENDIVAHYSGVRALASKRADDPQELSREYFLDFDLEVGEGKAPLLNIMGGKITTYRELAEDALHLLKNVFPSMGNAWTATVALPGGDIENHDFAKFQETAKQQYDWLPKNLLNRYARNYGTRLHVLLKDCTSMENLGQQFSENLYQCELDYLVKQEWAITAEDVLWRRTKLGLIEDPNEIDRITEEIGVYFRLSYDSNFSANS